MIGCAAGFASCVEALDDASEGHGSVFVLLGDAGIGKTGSPRRSPRRRPSAGTTCSGAAPWEAGGASAFWPWTQLIWHCSDARTPEEAIADLGTARRTSRRSRPRSGPRLGLRRPAADARQRGRALQRVRRVVSFLQRRRRAPPDRRRARRPACRRCGVACGLVEFLARGLHGARLLVIATVPHRRRAARHGRHARAHRSRTAGAAADAHRPLARGRPRARGRTVGPAGAGRSSSTACTR